MRGNTKVSQALSLDKIVKASERISDVITNTPILRNHNLSEKYGCDIWLKREDLQSVRSFKIRGAYNKIASLSDEQRSKGVICASAGNHAQGVAYACNKMSINGKIFMPSTTPSQKVKKVEHFGKKWIQIVLIGDSFDEAQQYAYEDQVTSGREFIHPFDDDEVIAGQGTIGLEIVNQLSKPLDFLFVAVGGGGLISGVSSCFKHLSPKTRIISVEAKGAPALRQSIINNQRIILDDIDVFADGIAVRQVGERTLEICKELIEEFILVDEGAICSSILKLYNEEAIVVEPAGAIGIAALEQYKNEIRGKNVGVIVCGGNNDVARTEEIRERALIWEGKKHYFIIRFPQRAGALKEFLNVLGPDDDISHFEYTKKNNRATGPALVGIELSSKEDFDLLLERMRNQRIDFEHINNRPILYEWIV